MGDQANTQIARQRQFLTESDRVTIQRFIQNEIRGKPFLPSPEDIYREVIKRLTKIKKFGVTESIRKCIFEMIEATLQNWMFKPTVDDGCERAKLTNRKGEKTKNETAKTSQLVEYDRDNYYPTSQEETERDEEMEQVLRQSRIDLNDEMEFEKKIQETLDKSYQEEKSKLLPMLTAADFDFGRLADQLNKVLPDGTAVSHKATTLEHRSALILAIIELLGHDYRIITAPPIQNHIRLFGQHCLSFGSRVTYQKGHHRKNPNSTFNVFSINEYLVNIEIRGDGNCMWSSVSHSLVGDYGMMESLRLLTADTLIQYSEQFSEMLKRQTSKFSYNALTVEELVTVSLTLQSWGDEFHLIALSLALKRPIYSYGSLIDIPESSVMGYEQFRQSYEIESFLNHFKFIGDAHDANNEPILLHYDGYSHYSCVLKRFYCVKPLVPFIQIIDAFFNGNEMAQPGEPEKLVDIESTEFVSNTAIEWKFHRSDYFTDDDDDDDDDGQGQSDQIRKLKKDLSDKDRLLQQYESFFQGVKQMLDNENIDLRQLRGFVERMENSKK
ncbi:uncharacterized protein LOC119082645 [Bradysia coprophila]|uniref:uncharacterized protein LOC119082645 n=1 Tax=Bradysia coprophila TaxID=38358 RepID=UPI00187D91AC|nr:uncharacterized protein LOC119082645 [Bradysia coprophila]